MTTRSERDRYHHGDLRNALLEASVRLIAARGAEGFSLREAARAVGVSPTAAYRHFADRTSLLAAVAVDGFSRLAAEMEAAVARAPGRPGAKGRAVAGLAAVGQAYFDFAVAHPAHFRVMFGPWMAEVADCVPGVGPSGKDPYQLLVEALDGLVAAGVIDADARAGAEIAAWSAIHGLSSLVVDGVLPLPPAERAAAVGLVLRQLGAGLGIPAALLPAGRPVDADPRKPHARR